MVYTHGATRESTMALTALPSMVTWVATAWISSAALSSEHVSAIAASVLKGLEELVMEDVLHSVVLDLLRKQVGPTPKSNSILKCNLDPIKSIYKILIQQNFESKHLCPKNVRSKKFYVRSLLSKIIFGP